MLLLCLRLSEIDNVALAPHVTYKCINTIFRDGATEFANVVQAAGFVRTRGCARARR